jgi:hypothetical protein
VDEDAAQALAYQCQLEQRGYEEEVLSLTEEKDSGEFDTNHW